MIFLLFILGHLAGSVNEGTRHPFDAQALSPRVFAFHSPKLVATFIRELFRIYPRDIVHPSKVLMIGGNSYLKHYLTEYWIPVYRITGRAYLTENDIVAKPPFYPIEKGSIRLIYFNWYVGKMSDRRSHQMTQIILNAIDLLELQGYFICENRILFSMVLMAKGFEKLPFATDNFIWWQRAA